MTMPPVLIRVSAFFKDKAPTKSKLKLFPTSEALPTITEMPIRISQEPPILNRENNCHRIDHIRDWLKQTLCKLSTSPVSTIRTQPEVTEKSLSSSCTPTRATFINSQGATGLD
jgi:hypothetical protein